MRKTILRLLFLCLTQICMVLANDVHAGKFQDWVAGRTDKLNNKGSLILTSRGPVQYVKKGHGPVVLSLHGGFGGWDQGLLIASNLISKGFTVIAPSRPGYLGTPLLSSTPLVELTAAQQADIMISLLDALHIDKVAVLGFSAGAPVAYLLAKQYPERVACTVLESIGAHPGEGFLFYAALAEALSIPTIPDYITYLINLSLKHDYYSTAKIALAQDTSLQGNALENRINYLTEISPEQYSFLYDITETSMPISPRLPGILNDFLGVNYWTTAFDPAGYTSPTIIVQAVNDSNGYFPTAKNVHAALPTSELIPVSDSGHLIWLGPTTTQWEHKVTAFLRTHLTH